jgi:hypothetical protein
MVACDIHVYEIFYGLFVPELTERDEYESSGYRP